MTDTLSWLALIFLTLTGYSSGAVLGSRIIVSRRGSAASPTLVDTAMVAVLWIGAIATRVTVLEPWVTVGVWLAVALVIGFVLNRVQPLLAESKALPQ